MQNYYVNNTNTDADGGGSVMPSHEAGANGYTYGDAVEISLSANAQSYNAEQVPNGERPPVGETVVVWGRVRELRDGGASSFSGWAETNGGDNSEYHYYGDVTAEETPPETQLIDNKPVEKPSYNYTDNNNRLHYVLNKTDMKKLLTTAMAVLGAKGVGDAWFQVPEKGRIVMEAFKATPLGRAVAAGELTLAFGLGLYLIDVDNDPDYTMYDIPGPTMNDLENNEPIDYGTFDAIEGRFRL